MPIWLRKFTYNKLKKYYTKKSETDQEDNIQKSISAMKQAKIDNIIPKQPTYTTKVSKK